MAKHTLYNVSLTASGTDLSTHVESVEFVVGINKQPASGMQQLQDRSMPGTQFVNDVRINFFQDYAASKVYATFLTLWQNRTSFNIVGKSDAGATSATNPAWTIPGFVAEMPLMTGTRGDRHMAPIVVAVDGDVTIATA